MEKASGVDGVASGRPECWGMCLPVGVDAVHAQFAGVFTGEAGDGYRVALFAVDAEASEEWAIGL